MKLQSTKTVRFEAKELRRLARMTRPKPETNILVMSATGFLVGLAIVVLMRVCFGP